MFTLVLLVAVTCACELDDLKIEPGFMPLLPGHLARGKCLDFLKFPTLKPPENQSGVAYVQCKHLKLYEHIRDTCLELDLVDYSAELYIKKNVCLCISYHIIISYY